MQEETSYLRPGDLLLINLPNPFSIYAQTYQVSESNTTNFTLQKTTRNSPRPFVSEDIPDTITGTHRLTQVRHEWRVTPYEFMTQDEEYTLSMTRVN